MRENIENAVLLACAIILVVAALVVAPDLQAARDRAMQPQPVMHRVDQPRCFPTGTTQTWGFPMCPDTNIRSV